MGQGIRDHGGSAHLLWSRVTTIGQFQVYNNPHGVTDCLGGVEEEFTISVDSSQHCQWTEENRPWLCDSSVDTMAGTCHLSSQLYNEFPAYAHSSGNGRSIRVNRFINSSTLVWMFQTADNKSIVVSAAQPLAVVPLLWQEWNNDNSSIHIADWVWERGYLSVVNQLICFGQESEQLERFHDDNSRICNAAEDLCLGGGDELICPFFTGQTLWWAILSTCVIIVVGLFLGLSITSTGLNGLKWQQIHINKEGLTMNLIGNLNLNFMGKLLRMFFWIRWT